MYVSEQDRTEKRKVSDKEVDESFQEALKYDPSLMIEESHVFKKTLFGKRAISFFHLYHETPAYDGSAYQARYQISGSGERKTVLAYLHGIINGCMHNKDGGIKHKN